MLHIIERLDPADFGEWDEPDTRDYEAVAADIIASMPDQATPEARNALLQMAAVIAISDSTTVTAKEFRFAFIDDRDGLDDLLWNYTATDIIPDFWDATDTIAKAWGDEPRWECLVEFAPQGTLSATNIHMLLERAWDNRRQIAEDWSDMDDETSPWPSPYQDHDTPRCVNFRRLTRHADVDNINKA